jgi:hypothetical protein
VMPVSRQKFVFPVLLSLAVAALSADLAHGQQQRVPSAVALENEEEPVRRYKVELIVFEYLDSSGSGEVFMPDVSDEPNPDDTYPSEMDPGDAAIFGDDAFRPAPTESLPEDEAGADVDRERLLLEPLEEIPTLETAGFEILDPTDYELNDVFDKLERLDAYRPLMRGAWIQPALERDETLPLKLRRIGDPPLRLDGTVTLYLSRFLHLVVDIALEEKSPVRPDALQDRIPYFGDNRSNAPYGVNPQFLAPSVFYRIEEDRILRSGDLRYYDHPRFGVLAKVMRVEDPEADDGIE